MGNEHRDLLGRDVVACDGARLGHVADVYVDPESGAPKWLALSAGFLSGGVSFVPLHGAGEDDHGRIVVAYTRKQVRRSPQPDADGDLGPAEEAALARHYLATVRAAASSPGFDDRNRPDPAYEATVETDLDDLRAEVEADERTEERLVAPGISPESMVRAEEELRVEASPRLAQRARLVKRVVTEQVTFTVPVRKEVLHLEYEDIDDEG